MKRNKANKGKKEAEKALATRVALFGNLPKECLTCKKSFDKLDKDQVTTWQVNVNHEKEIVNLYCPTCWGRAMEYKEEQ